MKKKVIKQAEKEVKAIEVYTERRIGNTIRKYKNDRQRIVTTLEINDGIQGESIETTLERIREGEGEETISDRDLVYNDNESSTVNPITNIRTDKFEAMLDEKIGMYDYQNKKHQKKTEDIEKVIKEENEKMNEKESSTEPGKTE